MDRRELTRILASLTDSEFGELVTEARTGLTVDVKSLIERELAKDPNALNNSDALTRAALGD
ncbi:hypothetical protein AU197_14475 [Mycobacterium sp. IS-1590]|uniref:hypothetical protein n=1 Tax=Mycobacterium sp. IS-1590 TaxID=1772286 RepID=UPI00074A3EC9|nr:hypothetical protein [Mycobacterium sp. IS-1590]KUI42316.1 hypothetical protein AU197_14475 [Mycobacterium sp. IS-1590]